LSARTLKLIVLSYAVKTALFGLAWLAIPDLPERASASLRAAWTAVSGPADPGPARR
jgi:hypothetical protein